MTTKPNHKREYKSFTSFITKADGVDGVVEAIASVIGNIDLGNDIIHPGSFVKTIHERGHKIKVLDNHNMRSAMDAIGKVEHIQEIGRDALPDELLAVVPDAQGGLLVRIRFMLDDDISAGIFKRIKAGVIDEYSIGFEIIEMDFSKVSHDDHEVEVRNIREIKLYEISPVIFAMNDATATVSAKDIPINLELGLPMPGIRKAGKQSCTDCVAYGHVSDTIGYCKSYDVGTYPSLCCDEYEIKTVIADNTVRDVIHDDASDLITQIADYLIGDTWTDKEVEQILAVKETMAAAMTALFPDDLLARPLKLEASTKDASNENEPIESTVESRNKADLIKEAMLLKHKIDTHNGGINNG